jgi:hypothetical protein
VVVKDQMGLLLAGIVCALLAAAFWRWLGADGWNVIGIIAIVSLAVENRRLRRELRQQRG